MIFIELVLENFGPYFGRQMINLRPESTQPIILVGGMNGGGKTTLMDALRLVLYGQRGQCSTRGNLSYSNFLKQCINRHTPEDEKTKLELLIEVVSNANLRSYYQNLNAEQEYRPTQLRIIRSWKKNDVKDTLGIIVNGELTDNALRESWDDYIENLLPLGISNLFLFDGEQVKELAELEAPPPVVVAAIQSLLGLELPERLSLDLEILSRRHQKELADKEEIANLDDIDGKIKHYEQEKYRVKQSISELQKSLSRANQRVKECSERFLTEGGKFAGEKHQLEWQQKRQEEQIEQTREALVSLAGGSLPLALIQPLLISAIAQGKAELNSIKAEITRDRLKDRDRRLLDYLHHLNLGDTETAKIANFLQQDYQNLAQEILAPENCPLKATEAEISILEYQISHDIPTQIEKAKTEYHYLEQLEAGLIEIEQKLTTAAAPEQYEQLMHQVTQAQQKQARFATDLEEKDRQLREIERELTTAKKELKKYSETILSRQNSAHIIQSISKVKSILEQFREKLTLKKLNKLENHVTECFRYLLHKTNLVHRVAINTHDFSLALYDSTGQPLPKHRLSAGEKQLLAIAFLWGLARVSGRQLPVAIDTPLGRLDSSHRQNLIERYFPAASHQVILLSTDTEIGHTEVENLRNQEAIARSYLLHYDSTQGQTTVQAGYFQFA